MSRLLCNVAVFMLLIVVLEACHSHVIVGRSKKLVKCKSKKREGKMCYYYAKGEYSHNHEHTHGSHGSHEHGHPHGSSDSSDKVSTEEDISLECGSKGCSSGSTETSVEIIVDEEGYVYCEEEEEIIEDIIGTCSTGCGAYELQVGLCPVGAKCSDGGKAAYDVVTDDSDGCMSLACQDSSYSLGVLGVNGELSLDAETLTCHKEKWYKRIDDKTALQFGKKITVVCYKL